MTKIDKKDIENIETLKKLLKSKNLGSIRIKKGVYEIEINSKSQNISTIPLDNKKENENLKKIKTLDDEIKKEDIVSSPMVGVVYLAPEPSKGNFVNEGQHVKQGDILMLIEAMKTFNEIKAPKSGIIKKILVLNNQPVEFGETLLIFD
tara:strand:- start:1133 stop:1579 length:447 start_codon:yes stop_codon:yes gene_type:complete